MNIKTAVIALFSFILGILLMRGLDALEPEIQHDDSILRKSLQQQDKKISEQAEIIIDLQSRKQIEIDTVIKIEKEYVLIEKKIDRANATDLGRALDSFISE